MVKYILNSKVDHLEVGLAFLIIDCRLIGLVVGFNRVSNVSKENNFLIEIDNSLSSRRNSEVLFYTVWCIVSQLIGD